MQIFVLVKNVKIKFIYLLSNITPVKADIVQETEVKYM